MRKKLLSLAKAASDAEFPVEQVLQGNLALLYVQGEPCAVGKSGDAWTVYNDEGDVYTVLNGRCTCPDSKFRGHRCKHVEGVDKLCGSREIS